MTGLFQMYESAPRLEVEALRIARGGRVLADGVTFSLRSGEALVALGPNGAGKTTLLRAIAGLVRPEAGAVRVRPDAAGAVGFLGHAEGLKAAETPREAVRFWTALDGGGASLAEEALHAVGAEAFADRAASRLSAGQKRRAAMARLAAQRRPVWILDEPAAPLDPGGRAMLRDLACRHRAAGGLVLAATHIDLDWPNAARLTFAAAGEPA